MKLKARIPIPKLLATLVVLQLTGAFFVHFRETLILHCTQIFGLFALVLLALLWFRQKDQRWGAVSGLELPRFRLLKTAGLFLFLFFFSWQVNFLSLSQTQPLMYTVEGMPIRYDIVPGDLLGYTLRLVMQTWCLGLALALALNRVPRGGEFGFIRGSYQKLSTVVWYLSNISGAAVILVLLFSLGLLTLDISKFIAKSAGADVMNVPQIELMVLVFSFYMLNLTLGFTKKLKQWGEHPEISLMFVILVQLLFIGIVYLLTMAMRQFLPYDTVYALMQPFYFNFLDYTRFPAYWALFVSGLSLFMVPLLAHYLMRACEGESISRSLIRLLLIPAGLGLLILTAFPSAQSIFFALSPTPSMPGIELNDLTSRYSVSWVSYFSVVILLALMIMLQRSRTLVKALVDVMPEQTGRRIKRVKAMLSRAFFLFVTLLVIYSLAGALISLYFTSLFLMGTLLGLGFCFVAALKQQEA
jgi:hypothetical protein